MRLSLKNLQPSSTYVIQARIKKDGAPGEWSQRYTFQTISPVTPPKTPTGVTWVSVGNAFHGEWDSVDQTTADSPSNIARYEIELTGSPGAVVGYEAVVPNDSGPKVTFDFSYEQNAARFITAKPTIAIRVREVDIRGLY